MVNHIEVHIPLPKQTQDKHSLFELNRDGAARWLQSLPSANLGEVTRQLYLALGELNKVHCNPRDRLQLLELLRNNVHMANRGLEKHFLNQPIILPEKARKVAQLADTLNKHMATGYTIAANELLGMHRLRRPKDLLSTAFHRALTEHSLVLLRNFQLYRDEEPGFWRTIHELFYQALKHKLGREKVADEIWGSGTLEQCYLRPMLMQTARPFQLRQKSQAQVFAQLASWAPKARVRGDKLDSCVFLFNPTRDEPPVYRELCDDLSGLLGIDAQALCAYLDELVAERSRAKNASDELSVTLLTHLHTSWSTMMQRNSVRVERDDELLLSLGLFSTHFFISGGLPFSDFMADESASKAETLELMDDMTLRQHVGRDRDTWSNVSSPDLKDREQKDYKPDHVLIEAISYEHSSKPAGSTQSTQNYRYYRTRMVNSSDRGYCVEWPASEAVKLNTGDVIGICEAIENTWSVGVIRWIKQVEGNRNQLGLEVLATAADAYGARRVHTGLASGEYQRALLLPPEGGAGQSQRILVQKPAFDEGDTVELTSPDQTYRIKLRHCLSTTASLALYDFSTMAKPEILETGLDYTSDPASEPGSQPETPNKKPEFEHLWKNL